MFSFTMPCADDMRRMTMTNGRSYEYEVMAWGKHDKRKLRKCANRLGDMFSDVFTLPPTRDTYELMRAVEDAIVSANSILEKLDGDECEQEESTPTY